MSTKSRKFVFVLRVRTFIFSKNKKESEQKNKRRKRRAIGKNNALMINHPVLIQQHFEITRAQQTKDEMKRERRATVIKNMMMQHRRIKSKAEN